MIYLSTGGFKNFTFKDTIELLSKEGISAFELSGGLYSNNVFEELKKLRTDYSLALHNYFPPPRDPFVFNLGSLNEAIAAKSIEHAKIAINCASIIKSDGEQFVEIIDDIYLKYNDKLRSKLKKIVDICISKDEFNKQYKNIDEIEREITFCHAEVCKSIMNSGLDVVGVCTKPDSRIGRGKDLIAHPVKNFALKMTFFF